MRSVVLIALVLAILAGCSDDVARVPSQPEGDRRPAPDFALPGLDGGTVRLADFRGEPLIVNFWASWCEPCKEEMPVLARFARANPRIAVVGIAVDDAPENSRRFARQVGVGFPLASDRDSRVIAEYGGTGLPVTVLVDAEGRIASTVLGEIGADDLETLKGIATP